MAYNVANLRQEAEKLRVKIKQLLNTNLKAILKDEGLPVSGVKAALQERIIEHMNNMIELEDAARFQQLADSINHHGGHTRPTPSSATSYVQSSNAVYSKQHVSANGHMAPTAQWSHSASTMNSYFKPSPFFEPQEQLAPIHVLPIMPGQRHSIHISMSLSAEHVNKMRGNSNLRVMVYSASELEHGQKDLAFPSQIEIRCNDEAYAGNLKGVKKKPGTTKPADITPFMRQQHYTKNQVTVTYAQTDRRFQVMIFLVLKHSVEELLRTIRNAPSITKDSVITEVKNKANDADIIFTSTKLSLKCPISAQRMKVPCRSTACNHNQCFDASSFLQLQEQAPQWTCPTCNKPCHFKSIAVDEFVTDILRSTPNTVDQVILEPNGTWKIHDPDSHGDFRSPAPKHTSSMKRKSEVLDVADGIEIVDEGSFVSKVGGRSTTSLPPVRQDSATASTTASNRPAAEVVDLTLSDDDEPVTKPIKRHSTGPAPLSVFQQSQSPQASYANPSPLTGPHVSSNAAMRHWMKHARMQPRDYAPSPSQTQRRNGIEAPSPPIFGSPGYHGWTNS